MILTGYTDVQPVFFIIFAGYMDTRTKDTLIEWAEEYNDPKYFQEDPIIFPTQFARRYAAGEATLADVEISVTYGYLIRVKGCTSTVQGYDDGRMVRCNSDRQLPCVGTGPSLDEDSSLVHLARAHLYLCSCRCLHLREHEEDRICDRVINC